MKSIIFIIFILLSILKPKAISGHNLHDKQIRLTIYYSTLCPDTKSFILKQLKPTYDLLSKYLSLEFVPFGKTEMTTKSGKVTFKCQKGPTECIGNMIHACAISEIKGEKNLMDFVACTMKDNARPLFSGEKCSKEVGIHFAKIIGCAKSKKGEELMKSHGTKTLGLKPKLTFVPTIAVDNSLDVSQEKILRKLRDVVCGTFNDVPKECY